MKLVLAEFSKFVKKIEEVEKANCTELGTMAELIFELKELSTSNTLCHSFLKLAFEVIKIFKNVCTAQLSACKEHFFPIKRSPLKDLNMTLTRIKSKSLFHRNSVFLHPSSTQNLRVCCLKSLLNTLKKS